MLSLYLVVLVEPVLDAPVVELLVVLENGAGARAHPAAASHLQEAVCNGENGHSSLLQGIKAAIRHYANQTARPL